MLLRSLDTRLFWLLTGTLFSFADQSSLGGAAAAKKPKVPVASIFGNDSDDEK